MSQQSWGVALACRLMQAHWRDALAKRICSVWTTVGLFPHFTRYALVALTLSMAGAAFAQTFPGAGTGPIPDSPGNGPENYGPPRDVTFNVSGITGALSDISLSITMDHIFIGDLDVVLAPPGVVPGDPGSFVIFSLVGAPDANPWGDGSDLNGTYVFEDSAPNNLWVAAAAVGDPTVIPPDDYRTSEPGPTPSPAANTSLLTAFGGLTPAEINGTWTLRFRDGFIDFTGSVSAASLTLSDALAPPTITSADNVTFTELSPGTFNVTATGSTPITFSLSGTLPAGVSFDGSTGELSGTPAFGSAGVYPLVITATNGTPPDDSQNFTLTVDPPPPGSLIQGGVVYTYANNTSLSIPDNSCPGGVTRTFNVSENFNVGGLGTIAVGVVVQHPTRGQLTLSLQAPNGAVQVLQTGSGGTLDNLNVTYTSNDDPGNVVNDGDNDPLSVAAGTVQYRRLVEVAGLDTFYSGPANGTWTLRICDGTAGGTGALQRAQLVLIDASTPAPQVCSGFSTFDWGSNGAGVPFTSINVAPDNVILSQISNSGEAPADGGSGVPSFVTRTTTQGAHTGYYALAMDTTGDTELTAESALFGFGVPVTGLNFTLLDVDRGASATSWEDYVRVTATGPLGRVPYHVQLDNTVNLAFAGDWVETDASADPGETFGNVTYSFRDAVDQVRVQYAQGNEPNSESVFQIIGISDFAFCAYDYGDAPLSFCDGVAANCPRHALPTRERLFIGSLPPDGETAPQFTAGADGDDVSLNNDEVGSITFPPPRTQFEGWVCGPYTTDPSTNEYCVTVSATNISGTAAQLVGWIDFNNNGTFDPGERSLPELQSTVTTGFNTGNIPNGSNNIQAILVFSPADPIPNNDTPSMLRLRLTTDPLFFSDATPPSHLGTARDGEVQDHAIPINTLPVTLAGFSAQRLDDFRIRVRWTTATEAGTLGYRTLQDSGSRGLHAIGSELIAATGVNSIVPQDYEIILRSRSDAPLYLEELSASGRNERFGPFRVGEVTGEELEFASQPWVEAAEEIAVMRSRQQSERRSRSSGTAGPVAELLVSETGIQRIALSDLQAAGFELAGSAEQLRLSLDGVEVPMAIDGDGSLSAGNHLLFLGQAIEDSQYTAVRPYRLDTSGGQLRWQPVSATPEGAVRTDRLRQRFTLDEDRFYSFSSPTADPWYFDTVQRNSASGGKSWTLNVPGPLEGQSYLTLELFGGIDFSGTTPDHLFAVSLNGVELGERTFDGVRAERYNFALPEGLLRAGGNQIRIDLLDTGYAADILRIESISVSAIAPILADAAVRGFAPGSLQARFDGISFSSFELADRDVPCGLACEQIEIGGFDQAELIAIHVTADGVRELRDFTITDEGRDRYTALLRTGDLLATADSDGAAPERIVVAGRDQAHKPDVRLAAESAHPLAGGAAELVAIAPYRFIDGIEPLLQARRGEGLSARVVDVEHLYQHYSNGIVDPKAIQAFLRDAYASLDTRYVVLVGGDTYDYFDRLELGSVSDIPTLYGRMHAVVSHAPLDHLYADINSDGSPELAVGRLPVRTEAELSALVTKILDYPNDLDASVVFAAERANPGEGADYSAESDLIIAQMDSDWQQNTSRIYLDDYAAGSAGVVAARADLGAAINQGRALVAYFGHGAPTLWSREQLIQSSQLDGLLDNAGANPIVAEFGCWGGYFVAPQFNTMSHGWLNAGQRGAAAMLASASLSEHESDREMAKVLLPMLQIPGTRIGDAVREAKSLLMSTAPEYADIVIGLTLFGDPSMPISQ